jgi:serine/threonine-protein kinase
VIYLWAKAEAGLIEERNPMNTAIGGKTFGNYCILEELGKGGMGIVYKAMDKGLEQVRALKVIYPELAHNAAFIKRFRKEAINLAKLTHPNIITIHAFDDKYPNIGPFIVMEYVEGENLKNIIERYGTISPQKALQIFKEVLVAMDYAHRKGIIHRDIKPSNIMLTKAGKVKIADFGLAKDLRDPGKSVTEGTAGTLYYMPPEQVKSLAEVDHRSDIYSVGMTFYEVLAGRTPFERDETNYTIQKRIVEEQFQPPDRFKPEIPKEMVRIIMKAIEKDPQKRFQTANEMLQALKTLEARPKNDNDKKSKNQKDSKPSPPRLKVLAFSSAVALLLGFFVFIIFSKGIPSIPQDPPEPPIPINEQPIGRGTLVLRVVPHGSVQVGGETFELNAEKEAALSTASGKHLIIFQHPVYGTHEASVTVKPDVKNAYTCYFEKYFYIRGLDEAGQEMQADIIVDNSMTYAQTPYSRYPLGPGNHQVTIHKRGYETYDGPKSIAMQPTVSNQFLAEQELTFHLRRIR